MCWGRSPSWCPGPSGQPGHLAWQTSHQVSSLPRQSHQEEAACSLCGPAGVGVDQPSVPRRPGRLGKGPPVAGCPGGWLVEGEPELPGMVRASLCRWVPGRAGTQAERDLHPGPASCSSLGLQPPSSSIRPVHKYQLRACMCWVLGIQVYQTAPRSQCGGEGRRE